MFRSEMAGSAFDPPPSSVFSGPSAWNIPPSARDCISVALISLLFLLAFQYPHDRKDYVPVSCGRRHTEELVDLAKIADRLHVATVHSKDESVFRSDNSHEP